MLNSPENGRSTCTYNHSHNLHQKFVSTSANFHLPISPLYLFPKPSLQFPPISPTSVTHQLLSSLFLHTAMPTIFSKNFFPTLTIYPIQTTSRDHEQGSLVRTDTVLISSNFSVLWTGIAALTLTDSLSFSLRKLFYCN